MSYPPPPPPPASDYFRASDHEGALMVFRVKEFDQRYSGWGEPQAAVRCDVEAVDPPAGPWYDAWVGNELIVGQLKESIGKTFFARLTKRGRAFILDPIAYGDDAKCDAWQEAKRRSISQVAAAQQQQQEDHGTWADGKRDPAEKPDPTAPTADLLRRNRVGSAGDDIPF